MNVDWDWVKQRPHFLAEGLSKHNEVLVLYPISWRRSELTFNPRKNVNLTALLCLPFAGRFFLIRAINVLLWKTYISFLLYSRKFDFIWVSSIELYESLPFKHKSKIIYDCMDDALAFRHSKIHHKKS